MPTPDTPTLVSASTPRGGRLRAAAAGLFIFLFAFLLASFPARNPDLWGHLASGRDLAHGRVPAISASRAADGRADSTWVFDLACYAIFSAAGPIGLVVAKAALAGALAIVLLQLSRSGPGWLIPAFCTGLAVLTLGSRLLLQPATASYLFLGLALWLLRPGTGRPSVALLVGLMAVWANTDRWFVVGLGVIGLVLVGRAIDQPAGRRTGTLGRAVVLLALLAAAGLLNPAHVWAYTLPWAAGPGAGGLGMTSPFRRAYVDAMAESPAGLAYLPLAGLGLFSFTLARPWRFERALPWAALAALSAWQVRFAPLFAVVGGPVLAWNLQDYFARRAAAGDIVGRRARFAIGALAAVFALAFLASAWVGWLQGPPFGPRRWAVETPPGLERGAETVCRWQADGRLGPEARALHLSADSVGAFAWFCPNHRAVRDPDLAAGIFGEPGGRTDWPARLRDAGITYLVVYDTDRRRLTSELDRLLSDPDQWPPLHLTGGVAVFGWRDPARPSGDDPFRSLRWDADRLAVWPAPEDRTPPARPGREPDPRRWWEAFWKPAPAATGDRDEAAVYLLLAEAERRTAVDRNWGAWQATQAAGLVAAAPGGYGPGGLLDLRTRLELGQPEMTETGGFAHPLGHLFQECGSAFRDARGDTSAAPLYLAVRAGRRAVAANPLDAQAHALLGEAYLRLIKQTREAAWGKELSELVQLRRTQAAAELNQAVTLSPGLGSAHEHLAALYVELGIIDLALKHQREYVAAVRRAGRPAGSDIDQYRVALATAEERLGRLSDLVREREESYDRQAGDLRVYDRALLATELGLGGKARDILLGSDISAFGDDGMTLELQLLARTGRVKEVRDWTAEEHQEVLGSFYLWLRAQAFAAGGDYVMARELCGQLAAAGLDPSIPNPPGAGPREVVTARVGMAILDGQYGPPGNRAGPIWEAFRQVDFRTSVRQLVTALRREADSLTLRGLLALEEGDTAAAAADFRRALRVWTAPEADPDAPRIDFNGRLAARQALDWIESVPPGPAP
jgi:tetratricopeptide (TPR) repeat protein